MANRCKYCGKEIFGLAMCNCSERLRYEKLWAKSPRCRKMKTEGKNGGKSKLKENKK